MGAFTPTCTVARFRAVFVSRPLWHELAVHSSSENQAARELFNSLGPCWGTINTPSMILSHPISPSGCSVPLYVAENIMHVCTLLWISNGCYITVQGDLIEAIPYTTTVCITHPPGAVFQGRLLENQEGANTERYVFGKLSARCFQRRPCWHRHYSSCGDIDHGKSAQGCVMHTVLYGNRHSLVDTFFLSCPHRGYIELTVWTNSFACSCLEENKYSGV